MYLKHGAGCTVYFQDGEIDFDFGRHGEINGFDPWRLFIFARKNCRYMVLKVRMTLKSALMWQFLKGI